MFVQNTEKKQVMKTGRDKGEDVRIQEKSERRAEARNT